MQEGELDEAINELHAVESRNPRRKDCRWNWSRPITAKTTFPGDRIFKKGESADAANDEAVECWGFRIFVEGIRPKPFLCSKKCRTGMRAQCGCGVHPRNRATSRRKLRSGPQVVWKDVRCAGDSAAGYLFTARMLLRQEYDPVAEEYAQKAAALDPRLPLAHFLLGELYLYKSRFRKLSPNFRRSWRSILRMQRRITSWRILAHSEYEEADRFYSAPSGWMRHLRGPSF